MMTTFNTTYTTLKTIFNTALKTIFWMTLHTTSALAATLILTLLSGTLTEETTTTLKHLQTTAALYYQKLAAETITTYAYQPNYLWETTIQHTIDLTLALAQQPQLILFTVFLASITAFIRYILMVHQLKTQQRPPRSYTRTIGKNTLLAKFTAVLPSPQATLKRLQQAASWLYWLYWLYEVLSLLRK